MPVVEHVSLMILIGLDALRYLGEAFSWHMFQQQDRV